MKNLGKKILAIMNDVKFIPKNGFNEEGSYTFVREADIAAKLRESLIKHGVCFLTSVKDSKIEAAKGGYLATVNIEVTLLDTETGETFTAGYTGTGLDYGDKAVYTATTGAEKYALLKIFLLETGDDPESSKGVKGKCEAVAPKAANVPAAPTAPAAQEEQVEVKRAEVTAPAPAPAAQGDLEEVVKALQGLGFNQVADDKTLKGTTYMIADGQIICRAFRRAMLEGLGFSWVPEAKAFKRAA